MSDFFLQYSTAVFKLPVEFMILNSKSTRTSWDGSRMREPRQEVQRRPADC